MSWHPRDDARAPRRATTVCALLLCVVALAACESPAPPPPPEAPTRVTEVVHAEQSSMTLSVRRAEQDGWSGQLVVVSVTPGGGRDVRVLAAERPTPLDVIVAGAHPAEPFAAINGGFYDTDSSAMGLVRTGGRDLAPLTEGGGSGVFYVQGDDVHVVHQERYEPSARITEALQSIDRLVDRGVTLVSPEASLRRAARSAVAIDAAGALHLAVAYDDRAIGEESEGRVELGPDSTRTGPTIAQWAELLIRSPQDGGVGAREVLGLDGGYSTSLVFKSRARALTVVAYHQTINSVLVRVDED